MEHVKVGRSLVADLEGFLARLRSYQGYVNAASLSADQMQSKSDLREWLVREIGALRPIVVELTGRRTFSAGGVTYNLWLEAFSPVSRYESEALTDCVDSTNEAIGRLEADIKKGIRNQRGEMIRKAKGPDSEAPKAFVAHGGDTPALVKLKNYLSALGIEPVVVEEQPSKGKSIGEKVDWYARQADFAVILATKGDKDSKTGGFIPRGNVLIEIGKAQELFPDRTIYLLQAGTEFPSNISEKVWVRFVPQSMDDSFSEIAKELCAFGMLKAVRPPRKE